MEENKTTYRIEARHAETGHHTSYGEVFIVDFLHGQLGAYGDPKEHIREAVRYAFDPQRGGYVFLLWEGNTPMGVAVLNKTGMKGYIPENILVYVAIHESARGKGYGEALLKEIIRTAEGNIALHVEPDNPAKKLYERLGFANKYLEMRLHR